MFYEFVIHKVIRGKAAYGIIKLPVTAQGRYIPSVSGVLGGYGGVQVKYGGVAVHIEVTCHFITVLGSLHGTACDVDLSLLEVELGDGTCHRLLKVHLVLFNTQLCELKVVLCNPYTSFGTSPIQDRYAHRHPDGLFVIEVTETLRQLVGRLCQSQAEIDRCLEPGL